MKRRSVSRGTIRESLTNTGRFNKTAAPGSRADEDNSELDYADDNMMSEDEEDDMMDDEVTASIHRQDKSVSIPRHADVKRLYAEAAKKTAGQDLNGEDFGWREITLPNGSRGAVITLDAGYDEPRTFADIAAEFARMFPTGNMVVQEAQGHGFEVVDYAVAINEVDMFEEWYNYGPTTASKKTAASEYRIEFDPADPSINWAGGWLVYMVKKREYASQEWKTREEAEEWANGPDPYWSAHWPHNASKKTAADELWSARATQRILNCPGCGNDDQNFFKFMYSDGSFNTFQCSDCMTEFMSDVHGTQTPIEMVTTLPFKKRNLQFEQLGYDGQMQASKTAANTNWDRKEGRMLFSDQFGRVWHSGGRTPTLQEFTFTEVEGQITIFATDIYAAEAKLRKSLHIADDEAIYNNKPFGWGPVTSSGKTANWGEDSLGKKMSPGEKMYTFIIDEDEDGNGEEIDVYASNDYDAEMYAKDAADDAMGAGRWTTISPIEPGGSGGQVFTFGGKTAGHEIQMECSVCGMPAEVVAHMRNGTRALLCAPCDQANRPDDQAWMTGYIPRNKFVDNSPFPSGSQFAPEASKTAMEHHLDLKQALMDHHGFNSQEAEDAIDEARDRVAEGEDPAEVLDDMGLEPDYIDELLD